MSLLPTLRLRPPAHRSYLNGCAGIPAATVTSGTDPLVDIPHRPSRTAATLSGIVEVKYPRDSDSTSFKAKWLRVELEKIEVVPKRTALDDEDEDDMIDETRFVELIGMRPEAVWEAKHVASNTSSKKGLFGKNRDDADWQIIPEGNYPFTIAVPEGLPASLDVDATGSGVSYQLVATLCVKSKKGLLKTMTKISTVTDSDVVLLQKSELLPAWPLFQPVLDSECVPIELPWAAPASSGLPTVGDSKLVRVPLQSDGEDVELVLKGLRNASAYGPGDDVQIAVELMWPGYETLKLSVVKAELVEQLVFRYPVDDRFGGTALRAHAKTTAVASVMHEFSSLPPSRSFLHPHQLRLIPLHLEVPPTHSVSTLKAAKFIEATYHLKVEIAFEGGKTAKLADWPVTISPINRRKAFELVREIGWSEKLCTRAGLSRFQNQVRARSPDLPSKPRCAVERASGDYSVVDSLRTETESLRHPNGHPPPSTTHRLSYSTNSHSHSSQSDSYRLSLAADEKRRLHDLATRTRDETQARYAAELAQSRAEKVRERQDNVADVKQSYQLRDEPARLRPVSDVTCSPTEIEPATMHTAALVRAPLPVNSLDVLRSALAKAPADRTIPEKQAVEALLNGQSLNGATMTRSSTTVARQGSVAGSGTDSGSSPSTVIHKDCPTLKTNPTALDLVRSKTKATNAENEKSRLFAAAREEANRRQDEARTVLDRRSSLERRSTRTVLKDEDESELERMRRLALSERDEIEARLREQERLDEAEFTRQEQERQQRARQEFEQRVRENERKRQLELQRLAEEQREREEGSKQAMLQRRREQDRIELERIQAEEKMREEEAQISAAENKLLVRIAAQQEEDQRWRDEQARQRQSDEETLHQERNKWSPRPSAPPNQDSLVSLATQHVGDGHLEELQDEFVMRPPRMPLASNLQRSGSIVSFAPSASAHEADVSFYAKAIAESHSSPTSSLQQDKAAYLAQLRQRDEARRVASSSSRSFQSSSVGKSRRSAHEFVLAPQPLPQTLERASFDPLLSFGHDMPSLRTPDQRFREPEQVHDMTAELPRHNPPSAPLNDHAQSAMSLRGPIEEHLPSYPNGHNNGRTAQERDPTSAVAESSNESTYNTVASASSESSAAQEKRALTAYYAAKAAVDAQSSSSAGPSRHHVIMPSLVDHDAARDPNVFDDKTEQDGQGSVEF
ncbi:hypothetical protein OIV83_004504 [Microbotryomycetes sp. JL201]|nr:hypothetical protein OIV83_004504 [Microbotryomycetes sp. JL201]